MLMDRLGSCFVAGGVFEELSEDGAAGLARQSIPQRSLYGHRVVHQPEAQLLQG